MATASAQARASKWSVAVGHGDALTTLAFGLLVVAAAANAISQMLLKTCAFVVGGHSAIATIVRLLMSSAFWAAIFWFLISLGIYVVLLSRHDAIVVFPAMALTHLFVLLLARIVLREHISPWRLAGTVAITTGVAMMVLGETFAAPGG